MRHGEGLRREPQSSTIPTPRFSKNPNTWASYWRNLCSNLYDGNSEVCHLGIAFLKFPDPDDFQCWRVNFKTELCVCTPFPQFTMSWVNEVEMGGSTDDLMASQSIRGKTFPDFEMLDARIASALRKIICSTSCRKKTLC